MGKGQLPLYRGLRDDSLLFPSKFIRGFKSFQMTAVMGDPTSLLTRGCLCRTSCLELISTKL